MVLAFLPIRFVLYRKASTSRVRTINIPTEKPAWPPGPPRNALNGSGAGVVVVVVFVYVVVVFVPVVVVEEAVVVVVVVDTLVVVVLVPVVVKSFNL